MMGNALGAVGSTISSALSPVGEVLKPVTEPVGSALGTVGNFLYGEVTLQRQLELTWRCALQMLTLPFPFLANFAVRADPSAATIHTGHFLARRIVNSKLVDQPD